jgi:hypothetical protein
MRPSTTALPVLTLAALLSSLGTAPASADPLPFPLPTSPVLPVAPLPTVPTLPAPLPTAPPVVPQAPTTMPTPSGATTVGRAAKTVTSPRLTADTATGAVELTGGERPATLPSGTATAPLLARTALPAWASTLMAPMTATSSPRLAPPTKPTSLRVRHVSKDQAPGVPVPVAALAFLVLGATAGGHVLARRR